jgi:hypothetical protein
MENFRYSIRNSRLNSLTHRPLFNSIRLLKYILPHVYKIIGYDIKIAKIIITTQLLIRAALAWWRSGVME